MARLVWLETVGIQDFIFATNKLKQIVGASELVHRIGTSFVLSAVAKEVPEYGSLARDLESAYRVIGEKNGRPLFAGDPVATGDYVERLAEIARNHPINPGTSVEVLFATSGKAMLLVESFEIGKRIIEYVTWRSLREAPGAVVRGIVDSDEGELDLDRDSDEVANLRLNNIYRAVDRLRLTLPPPEARFPTLPIVAPCATSGLPAEHREAGEYISASARSKRDAAAAGWRRVEAVLEKEDRFARDIDRLEDLGLPWLAVVHADGNGMGKVFSNLVAHMPTPLRGSARKFFSFYRDLSLALDLVGAAALKASLKVFESRTIKVRDRDLELLPVVPLVSGGDDLTIVCDGSSAVTFAETYLNEFEESTNRSHISGTGFESVIPLLIDPKRRNRKSLGGSAGIAIVKPHHPFHRAHDLAADLTASAKQVKRLLDNDAASALDFQIVYQDAAANLDILRAVWQVDETTRRRRRQGSAVEASSSGLGPQEWIHARPYVVSDLSVEDRFALTRDSKAWAAQRHFSKLKAAVAALAVPRDSDDTDRHASGLPRSQQHGLRAALFEGKSIADARLALVRGRYDIDWSTFGDSDESLFFQDPHAHGHYLTRFIDALEIIDIREQLADVGNRPRTAGAEAAE